MAVPTKNPRSSFGMSSFLRVGHILTIFLPIFFHLYFFTGCH